MQGSLEQLLDQVAKRGSWLGGGSVVALSAALSAALLEKLIANPVQARRLRRIRQECVALIERDARAFARVIRASRRGTSRRLFERALQAATRAPLQVFTHAQALCAAANAAERSVKPRFRSDLRCALALARASRDGAKALILTNLIWLNDASYARTVRRHLSRSR